MTTDMTTSLLASNISEMGHGGYETNSEDIEMDYPGAMDMDVSPALLKMTQFLTKYIQPALCIFGVIGHTLSFVIFLSKNMRKISSNIYLAALSGSSVGFNIILFLQWLEMIQVPLMHRHGFCQAIVYFGYVFSFLSIWFIVCITVENYIVTFHQSRAVTYCSVIRAKIAVTVTVVCAVLMYMGQFWIATVVDFGDGMVFCTEAEEYRYLNRIYFFYDSIVTLIIPSMVTTALILVIVVRNMCIHRSLANKKLSKKQEALLRITRVLLAISLTFVILSAPTHANKLRHLIIVEMFGQQNYSLEDRVLQHFFQILYYLSFSLNFVYYLIWSINFRKEFKRLFCFKTRPRIMRRLELMAGNGHVVGKEAINHTQRITLL